MKNAGCLAGRRSSLLPSVVNVLNSSVRLRAVLGYEGTSPKVQYSTL